MSSDPNFSKSQTPPLQTPPLQTPPLQHATSENGSCLAIFGKLQCRSRTAAFVFLQCGSHFYQKLRCNEQNNCTATLLSYPADPTLAVGPGLSGPLFVSMTQKNPPVRKMFCPRFWGQKWLRQFYGRLAFLCCFCWQTPMPIQINSSSGKPNQRKWGSQTFGEESGAQFANPLSRAFATGIPSLRSGLQTLFVELPNCC